LTLELISAVPPVQNRTSQDLARLTAAYRHLPGVLAASAGLTTALQGGDTLDIPIQLCAVDTNTFAQAALWTAQDSSQPLPSLMKLLRSAQQQALAQGQLAAIVDANAAQALHLTPQTPFTLSTSNGIELSLIDVAEVHFIPTIASSNVPSGSSSDYVPAGGVLVDYQTYALLLSMMPQFRGQGVSVPLNYVWLKTVDDPRTLAALRSQLNAGPLQLAPMEDRRAESEAQQHQALYLNLIGMLAIGTITALLLAIFGSLVASWLSVRSRLTSFALMRALGSGPGRLAAVLMWEQSMIYSSALVLGLAFGLLIARLAVPAMVFSGTASSSTTFSAGAFYVAQNVPPIQIIFPPWLLAVPAGLILLCGLALAIMVRMAVRPSIS
jgi:putative ABC transport system permease protein